MNEIIQLYSNLKEKIKQIQDDIEINLNITQEEVPSSALSNIFNVVTLAVEILS